MLQRAVEEERYEDAIFVRDHAGAGLVSFLRYVLCNYVKILLKYFLACALVCMACISQLLRTSNPKSDHRI